MAEVKNITLEALERHCASGDTGRLDFRRGDYEGQIYVDEKLIVHAQISGLEAFRPCFASSIGATRKQPGWPGSNRKRRRCISPWRRPPCFTRRTCRTARSWKPRR